MYRQFVYTVCIYESLIPISVSVFVSVCRCAFCSGSGLVKCRTCAGRAVLKCYIQLRVEWQVHTNDYLNASNAARVPLEIVRKVPGRYIVLGELLHSLEIVMLVTFLGSNRKVSWEFYQIVNLSIQTFAIENSRSENFQRTRNIVKDIIFEGYIVE